MSFLTGLQRKSPAAKMRIIWAVAIAAVVLLIIIWAVSAKFHKNSAKDTTLFQTIGQGVNDVQNNYKK